MTVPHITRSEQELIALYLQEKTDAGTARQLGVSPKVVRRRRLAIYAKLNVRNREELFRISVQEGMIMIQAKHLITPQLKE